MYKGNFSISENIYVSNALDEVVLTPTRNSIFDAIKAIAIFLVILGHCIQYLSGIDYWNDKLFQFIYSFHMPLFFMISGFFFASNMKLSIWEFLRKKGLSLLLPCFVWAIVYSFLHFQSWSVLVKGIFIPAHWPFWFFKGLFLVQLTAYLSMKIAERIGGTKIQLSSSILISLIVYVMPYMGVARVMIPIFWIGYAMKMYYEQYIRYHRPIGLIALIVFAGLYYFWNGEIMHYSASASVTLYHVVLGKHGYTLLNFLMLAYRICLGIAGAVAVISLMHEVKNVNKFITYVGSSTAGIYILQATILEIVLYRIFFNYVNLSGISKLSIYFIMFVIAIGLVALLTWLYRFLSRNSVVDLILFGCGRLTKKIIKQE